MNDNKVILFQYDFRNEADVSQHNGYFIDNEGNVLTYNNPPEWNYPDQNLVISQKLLAENLSRCSNSGRKINSDDLRRYSSFIDNIAASKITAVKNTGSDTGTAKFICYQSSATSDLFRGNIIKMEGDQTCENLNFFAKRISSWMKEVGNALATD